MTQLQSGLAVVVAIIAVLAFAAAALAYVKNSIDKATIITLEKNSDALSDRVIVLEREVQRLDGEGKTKDARIDALERENEILQKQRPSADAIAALDRKLSDHDTRTMKLLRSKAAR